MKRVPVSEEDHFVCDGMVAPEYLNATEKRNEMSKYAGGF